MAAKKGAGPYRESQMNPVTITEFPEEVINWLRNSDDRWIEVKFIRGMWEVKIGVFIGLDKLSLQGVWVAHDLYDCMLRALKNLQDKVK